jgi:hypothetical protein
MRGITSFMLYYLVVTPVGLLCRLVHDPLHRKWLPQAASYLTYLENGEPSLVWRGAFEK